MIASSFVEDHLDERMATDDLENGIGRLMKRYGDVGQEESNMTTIVMTLTVLWIGSLVAGILPYRIQFKSSFQLHLVSALGGGLLIGSALGIIIPEGFHALPSEPHDHNDGHDEDASIQAGLPGLALIMGFLVMMVLEAAQHGHCSMHATMSTEDQQCLDSGDKGSDDAELEAQKRDGTVQGSMLHGCGSSSRLHSHHQHSSGPEAAIKGLLIHCMADGLAMGSAFLSGNAALTLIIATAMILHKAPMAFGLGTYLLACNIPWTSAQKIILVFSLTAPVATIVTYIIFTIVPALATPLAVSLAVLFSGGTFLHAATFHILPDILHGKGHYGPHTIASIAVGSIIPVILSWNHHH